MALSNAEKQRRYRERHPERCKEQQRRYRQSERGREKNRDWLEKNRHVSLDATRKWRYGVSSEDYKALADKQQGRCAICGRKPDENLSVDHCHDTGRVRGLLCRRCNSGLGYFQDRSDWLQQAAEYLQCH